MPPDHLDLLERPLLGALSTLLPDGQPQTQPVWFSYEPPWLLINTMQGFRKERNLRADPRATLLVIDPTNSSRWIEVWGSVDLIEVGARAHLDELARMYAGADHFFGGCVPAELENRQVPIIGRITPIHVVDEHSADRMPRVTGTLAPARRSPRGRAPLPASHLDLLHRPLIGILSTLMPDGQPQTQPVWFALEGQDLAINTTRERQKGKNLERDPRATLLVIDPADTNRWIEVRGLVEVTERGALEHLDRLTRAYTPWPSYYGYVHPAERRFRETRIIGRLVPQHVVCDAIYRALHSSNGDEPTKAQHGLGSV
ncbi:MAG TPA: TIGR03618 family F420-dependent PPOX class oxidoreductase [Candidatus Dormibacteraeota bacterium]